VGVLEGTAFASICPSALSSRETFLAHLVAKSGHAQAASVISRLERVELLFSVFCATVDGVLERGRGLALSADAARVRIIHAREKEALGEGETAVSEEWHALEQDRLSLLATSAAEEKR
jgi:hypothetical protein